MLLETGNIFRLCLLSCSRDEGGGTLHTIWILMRLQLNGAGGEGFAMYVYLMLADIKFTCLPSSQKREREKDWHRGLTSEDDAAPPLHFPFTKTEPPKSNPGIRRRSLAWLLSSHVPAYTLVRAIFPRTLSPGTGVVGFIRRRNNLWILKDKSISDKFSSAVVPTFGPFFLVVVECMCEMGSLLP